MSSTDKEVILALADNNMNISAAATSLFMHRNNVEYHIRRIKQITGLDAKNFYDLIKLVNMTG